MNRKAFRRVQLAAVLTALCSVAAGQTSKPGTGTVTGHVVCQDTQKPARFAQVMVFSVPATLTTMGKMDATDSKTIQAFTKAMTDAMNSASLVLTQTGFDGSFVMTDVAPGDYYMMASVAGYVQPQNLVQAAYDAGEDLTKGISGVPMVRVSADRSASAEVSVVRGAAIEGHVLWDDGEPVNAATVSADPKSGEHKPLPPQFNMVSLSGISMGNTDDRGHYRISGLAPGEYTVRVVLQTNRRMSVQKGRFDPSANFGLGLLVVYAPGGFRKMDAKPVTLSAGEERTDEDVTFNLSATHTVSGKVMSAEDHHGLNRAVVMLTDTSEKTFVRSGGVDADGNFSVLFVPAGTYTMTVANGADTVPEEPKKPDQGALFVMSQAKAVRTYQKAEQQVMVTDSDLSGQNIELKPEKVQPDAEDAGR
jgi:hypothetical protein